MHPIQPLALTEPIQLIVADLDGCVTTNAADGFPLELFARLREYAARAASDSSVPRLTFNTGRPQPYVEALARLAQVETPALCDGGLVMWELPSRRIRLHPDLTIEDRRRFQQLTSLALAMIEDESARFTIEPGKIAEFTLLPHRPHTTEDILPFALRLHEAVGGGMRIDHTHAVVSLVPPTLDKGTGLDWLASVTGVAPTAMVGIGDSDVDWAFLQRTAASWVPSNGSPWLKQRATVPSNLPAGAVIVEMFESVIAANKALLQRP